MANTNKPTPPESVDEAVAAAPDPSTSKGSKKVVRVMYPQDRFVVEDVPVITTEGTELTAEQVKKVIAAARDDNQIHLIDGDGNPLDNEETK